MGLSEPNNVKWNSKIRNIIEETMKKKSDKNADYLSPRNSKKRIHKKQNHHKIRIFIQIS